MASPITARVDFNDSGTNHGTVTVQYTASYSNDANDTCTIKIVEVRYGHSSGYGHTIGVTLKIGGTKVFSTSGRKVAYNSGSYVVSSGGQTKVYSKAHNTQPVVIEVTLSDRLDNYEGREYSTKRTLSKTSSDTYTISAKSSWAVTYNANGGTGAPANQTKWAYETLYLSSVKPTRSGYFFHHWNTSNTDSGTTYDPGSSYTGNAALYLYAIWASTITYNANGGSGAPASQTKVYNRSITLSTEVPVRAGYTFVGWGGSSASTTASYQPGATYTSNTSTILYAVWKRTCVAPTITSLTAIRCNSSGTADDEGTYCKVACVWKVDTTSETVTSNYGTVTGTYTVYGTSTSRSITWSSGAGGSGVTSGTATAIISGISVDNAYVIMVSVKDKADNITGAQRTTSRATICTGAEYFLDFKAGGEALGIGCAAPDDGLKIGWPTSILGQLNVSNGRVVVKSDEISVSAASSSQLVGNGLRMTDKSDHILADFQISKEATDKTQLLITVRGSRNYPQDATKGADVKFGLIAPRTNTTGEYYVSHPVTFRNALGATSGVFPRAAGGTGQSSRSSTALTRQTNISSSAGSAYIYYNGVMATLIVTGITLAAALASGSSVAILTIPSAPPKPPVTMWAQVMSTNATATGKGYVQVATGGAITFYNRSGASWATSYPIAFSLSWAL